jgi:phage/plasmid primase-like uncharacterized protein
LSLSYSEDGKLLAYCFGGHNFDEIRSVLVEYGLLDDIDNANLVPNRSVICPRDDGERITHARRIYDVCAPDERVGTYLRSRGIALTSLVLRFSEQAPHRLGVRLPAMIAPVVDVEGEQTGVHLTYLRPDGSGKANLGNPDYQHECRGVIRGGAIRLTSHDAYREMIIGEGIESTISAMELCNLAGWAAVYAGNLKDTLELPVAVRHVVIAADNDASGTGQRAAIAAHRRWTAEGRSVRIIMPPYTGTDFNDLLMARC